MKTGKQSLSPPGWDAAQFIVDLLNGSPEGHFDRDVRRELEKIINAWLESGPDTSRMLRDNPGLIPAVWRCVVLPTRTGRMTPGYLARTASRSSRLAPRVLALSLYFQFVMTTDCDKRRPGGPCACGCGEYFVTGTKHRKIYCKGHGSAVSAREAMKQKQAKERAPRVRQINKAVRRYEELGLRNDWMMVIETETGVARRTLAKWVEKGFIQPPKGRQ